MLFKVSDIIVISSILPLSTLKPHLKLRNYQFKKSTLKYFLLSRLKLPFKTSKLEFKFSIHATECWPGTIKINSSIILRLVLTQILLRKSAILQFRGILKILKVLNKPLILYLWLKD